MNMRDAVALLSGAVPRRPGAWADLGAGTGTFTGALARVLGPGSSIYALDRNPEAIRSLTRFAHVDGIRVIPVLGDFTRPAVLSGAVSQTLDGMLFANALHFVRDPSAVLSRLVPMLKPGGRVVIIEYDRRAASRWVPYPIASTRLAEITAAAGLSEPTITATRPSSYGGDLYVSRTTSYSQGSQP